MSVRRTIGFVAMFVAADLAITACSGGGTAPTPLTPSTSDAAHKPQVVERGDGNQLIKFPIGSTGNVSPYRMIQSAGKLWFTEANEPAIGSMTTSGATSEFTVSGVSGGSTSSLVAGPSASIWFVGQPTGFVPSYIAYTNSTASASPISVPTPATLPGATAPCPYAVAEGSDKAIWFTDPCNNAVGRIDPVAKRVTAEYALPTANADPEDIVEGSDGNLWLGEKTGFNVARVTPRPAGAPGFITEYSVGAASPIFLTSAFGNIWFSFNGCTNEVCPYEGVGTIGTGAKPNATLFLTDGNEIAETDAIVQGPDGNIWFSNFSDGSFGSITPAGTFNGPPISSSIATFGLVTGPDKNVWVADARGDSIDVAVLNPQTVTPTSIAFNMVGETQTFAASEAGATLTVTTSNAKVATVAAAGTPGSWTVTAVGAGSCTIRVSDQNGNYTPIGVSVTTETFVIR